MIPLGMVAPGARVKVVAIHGGGRVRKRLGDLGVTPGTELQIVQSGGRGPILLAFKDDARLALGRGISLKIQVEPLDAESE
ncbi:MAG: ferrous iron transport protein A [Chloroflexota bacterium]|nr:ferrous iron transport protein A [Chloroflexota bacterium]